MKTVDCNGFTLKIGNRVHVNADTEEWGRVASDATVVDLFGDEVQLEVDSIRATLTVWAREVEVREPTNVYSRQTGKRLS